MLPDPGGSRQPPDKPPHTAVDLGGPDGDDEKAKKIEELRQHLKAVDPKNWKIQKEAMAVVKNLHDIANVIRQKLDQPDDRKEYMALLEYCLRLIDQAMKLARGK
jgi:predicted transcriptional regulator